MNREERKIAVGVLCWWLLVWSVFGCVWAAVCAEDRVERTHGWVRQ